MTTIIDALAPGGDRCVIPGHGALAASPEASGLSFTAEVERVTDT